MKAGVSDDGYVFPARIQARSSHTVGRGSPIVRSNGEEAMFVAEWTRMTIWSAVSEYFVASLFWCSVNS